MQVRVTAGWGGSAAVLRRGSASGWAARANSVERGGIGSREGSWRGPRLLASGAGACEQAHEAGGTCTYGNPAGTIQRRR